MLYCTNIDDIFYAELAFDKRRRTQILLFELTFKARNSKTAITTATQIIGNSLYGGMNFNGDKHNVIDYFTTLNTSNENC